MTDGAECRSLELQGLPGYEIGDDGRVWSYAKGERRQLKTFCKNHIKSQAIEVQLTVGRRKVGKIVAPGRAGRPGRTEGGQAVNYFP